MLSDKDTSKGLEERKMKISPLFFASSNLPKSKDWVKYADDLYINADLFNYGMTAVVPASEDNWLSIIDKNNIHFSGQTADTGIMGEIDKSTASTNATIENDDLFSDSDSLQSDPDVTSNVPNQRVLSFLPKNTIPKPKTPSPKLRNYALSEYELSLFNEDSLALNTLTQKEDPLNDLDPLLSQPKYRALRHSINQNIKCLTRLANYANRKTTKSVLICTNYQQQFAVIHRGRRDEIFLPASIDGIGSYICLSHNKISENFSGFNQVVMAGCLFGSALKARNNKKAGAGGSSPL